MENGKWRMDNGEKQTAIGNGKWKMENGEKQTAIGKGQWAIGIVVFIEKSP